MKFRIVPVLLAFAVLPTMQAQDRSPDDQAHIQPRKKVPKQNEPPPQDEPAQQPGESSSADSKIVLGPSLGSNGAGSNDNNSGSSDVNETHPFDPHRAAKDVEVGEFYLRQKNYRAALDRFNDALLYKPKDAVATFRLAQTEEQMGLLEAAYRNYDSYLEILPQGPLAKDAKDALKRIDPQLDANQSGGPEAAHVRQDIELGESYLSRNQFASALQRFEEAVRMAPEDPLVNLRLAESLQGLQRLDQARLFYKKYLSLQPTGRYASDAKKGIAQINAILGK
jgi:Tfp pilus assembly protein PilF